VVKIIAFLEVEKNRVQSFQALLKFQSMEALPQISLSVADPGIQPPKILYQRNRVRCNKTGVN